MKSQQSKAFTIERNCDGREAEIAAVVEAAFRVEYGSGAGEVALIAALRAAGDDVAEFIALEDGMVVGHAMFSRMTAEPAHRNVAALAPVCARIDRQKTGIGGALIRAGLAACAEQGFSAAIVLGDPEYYGRFGFSAAKAEGIACAFAGPHLQALELIPDTLKGLSALAYAPAFSAV